ncbi:hypothetical protein KKG46_00140 [Patescibacteria group bacterium]|nr:hypothetical protein [Patescibacteria group bacterium]
MSQDTEYISALFQLWTRVVDLTEEQCLYICTLDLDSTQAITEVVKKFKPEQSNKADLSADIKISGYHTWSTYDLMAEFGTTYKAEVYSDLIKRLVHLGLSDNLYTLVLSLQDPWLRVVGELALAELELSENVFLALRLASHLTDPSGTT